MNVALNCVAMTLAALYC